MNTDVTNIPVERIRVPNPRHRDKKRFAIVVESIRNSGLKKPIQVTVRTSTEEEGIWYDLVCGQGRKEAFEVLGYKEIPAIIVEADREKSMIMSLVENMARRIPNVQEMVDEILRLKELGYSHAAIGKKLDVAVSFVSGLLTLKNAGEERLIHEAMHGQIPIGTAIQIAKVEGAEQQREFLEAYEKGHFNQAAIRTVRRVLAQRAAFSKKLSGYPGATKSQSAEGIVDTLKKESQRQKALIRKTQICEARLLFIVGAFDQLLADEDFLNLMRAENLDSIPRELSIKLQRN